MVLPTRVHAGTPLPRKAPATVVATDQDPLGRSTPRGAFLGFIKAAGAESYERAAQYLDTRRSPRRAEELSRQLKVLLDRGLRAQDLDLLSAAPEGNLDDDLPPNRERVGTVKGGSTELEVLLQRVQREGGPIWLFSADTLKEIPSVYEELRPAWVERFVPGSLQAVQFADLPLWQWIVLTLAIPFALGFAWLVNRGFLLVLRPLLFRLTGERGDGHLARIFGPARVLALTVALMTWTALSGLPLLARFFWTRVAVAVGIVGGAWLLLRFADIVAELTETHLRQVSQPGRVAITQLVRRLTKLAVILVGFLALLYLANVDLTAALAGLGIGGIAIAFAAQKTLENLFGGILIISDQPVRMGDFCKIGDVTGTVEDIGLRSTRIRTLDRTVVSIPNGQIAAVNVENFGVRDRIWLHQTIGLRHETTPDQLRYVLAEIRQMLYGHPMVDTQSARVRFIRLGSSSLDLELFAYVLTSDYAIFLEVQEDLLLRIMDIVEASGTKMAFPSQTAYLTRDSGLDEAKTQAAVAAVRRWREEGNLPFPNFRPERIAEMQDRLDYPSPDSALRRDDDAR